MRLLLLTGARRGEVLAATWEQFDIEKGVWTKPSSHTKQKKVHRVPLASAAMILLEQMRSASASTYLFPSNTPEGHVTEIKHSWASICKSAQITDMRLHDLRHSYASIFAGAGLSLPVIGALLGHTQPATTARYAHLADDPLRAATDTIDPTI